jgi:hypothetical protein
VSEPSAIPRSALLALFENAERAAAAGDEAAAKTILSDLHWFGHADGDLHARIHRLEMRMARARGDLGGAIGQVLPKAFARAVSFTESLGPSFEVVETIAAPPEVVYGVIADIGAYDEWNPWIRKAKGAASHPGDELAVDVKLGDSRWMRVRHRVLIASPPLRFGWCDLGWFTPLAGGRRLRWIERVDGGSRLVGCIRLFGPFARLAWWLYGHSIRDGMTAEAKALAARAKVLSGANGARSNGASHAAVS